MRKLCRTLAAVLLAMALLCGLALPAAAAVDTKAYAADVVKLINAERKKAGLPALITDKALSAAAMTRAKEVKKSFSHKRPGGGEWHTVLKDNKINYTRAGENIAKGQKTPSGVMSAWMNSKGHKANILGDYNRVGIGVYESGGTIYWVQLFVKGTGGSVPESRFERTLSLVLDILRTGFQLVLDYIEYLLNLGYGLGVRAWKQIAKLF